MLREIELENFKPFSSKQRFPLSKITLIYGPNSGGKSSIIQALVLMKQSLDPLGFLGHGLMTRGPYIDLGSVNSILHKHENQRLFKISLKYDALETRKQIIPQPPDADITREITTTYRAARSRSLRTEHDSELAHVTYKLSGSKNLDLHLHKAKQQTQEDLNWPSDAVIFHWDNSASVRSLAHYLTQNTDSYEYQLLARERRFTAQNYENIITKSVLLAPEGLPSRLSNRRDVNTQESYYVQFQAERILTGITAEYYSLLGSIYYLGPLRSHPARHYLSIGGKADTVGAKGEYAPQVIFQYRRQIEKRVNEWFEQFGIPYHLRVSSIGNEVTGELIAMSLLDRRTNVEVAPADVGFGIGQLLPIIVEGVVSRNRILCVEQPEIHLHPRLQASVADLLIKTAGITDREQDRHLQSRDNQWIIETHSEALMLRIQRRIRQKAIKNTDVSVIYVDPAGEGGSRIIPLRLNEDGEFIDEWPHGFFEEGYREQFDLGD
ncbi:AAA family ATPase [Archangium sp.]|uniref:AAA family ATPase n=1 Tax=Archangium sp. TaxID=1872627 RepID=UPI00389AF085